MDYIIASYNYIKLLFNSNVFYRFSFKKNYKSLNDLNSLNEQNSHEHRIG